MSIDPREEALAYLEQHNLLKIFDYLGAKLASEKPSDPNALLVSELTAIMHATARGNPVTLFSEKDVDALFSVFDITNKGVLSIDQYNQALVYVGVKINKFPLPSTDTVDRKTFVKMVLDEINAVAI